jgi:hypothetical protein
MLAAGGSLDHESCEKSRKTRKSARWQASLFVYFVGFRDLRVPTPQEPPIRHAPTMVASSEVLAHPGRSELNL